LRRSGNNAEDVFDTYYVYDKFDNLSFIITPKAVDLMNQSNSWDSQALEEDLIFRFKYDIRKRMVEKKVPGRQAVFYIYDVLDRLVLAQDGNLRTQAKWEFYKYDIFSRLVQIGIKKDLNYIERPDMQNFADGFVNNSTTFFYEERVPESPQYPDGFTNQAFPSVIITDPDTKTMVCHYYDQYPVDVLTGYYRFRTDPSVQTGTFFERINGKLTMQKTLSLDPANENWMKTIFFYDQYGRTIETLSENQLGGLDAYLYEYDFEGKLIKSLSVHNIELPPSGGYQTIRVTERFQYDHQGRLKIHYHKVNDQDEIILKQIKYNELGQVVEKNLHSVDDGINYLQSVDYRYNTRGWLTQINRSDLTNSNSYSQNEITLQTDESVGGMALDTVTIGFELADEHGTNFRVKTSISDYKRLYINNLQNPANNRILQNNETDLYEFYENEPQDSLRYLYFFPLNQRQFYFDFNELYFDENDDPEELMDTMAVIIDDQLIGQDITDSTTRSYIIYMVLSYEKSKLGIIYFNEDQDDLFGLDILYNQGFPELNTPGQFNGNISSIRWQQKGTPGQRAYGFQYDDLNQLSEADYIERGSAGWSVNPGHYDENGITYDQNGNILLLSRSGIIGFDQQTNDPVYGEMDDLEYSYDGNQLKKVDDRINVNIPNNDFRDYSNSEDEYGYDSNGNLVRDDNKGIIDIVYNFLNLPVEINFGEGEKILYLYDAMGNKMSKKVFQDDQLIHTTLYSSGVIYQIVAGGNPEVQLIGTPEGRLIPVTGGVQYQYFLKDHLGNVRTVFTDYEPDGTVDIVQEDHYYPFGLTMKGLGGVNGVENRFLYQSKEFQPDGFDRNGDLSTDISLDWYDFGARYYDQQLGRWHVPDPVNQYLSPYLAMGNNPVSIIDPNGCYAYGLIWLFLNSAAWRLCRFHEAIQDAYDGAYGRGAYGLNDPQYGWSPLDVIGNSIGGGGTISDSDGSTIYNYLNTIENISDVTFYTSNLPLLNGNGKLHFWALNSNGNCVWSSGWGGRVNGFYTCQGDDPGGTFFGGDGENYYSPSGGGDQYVIDDPTISQNYSYGHPGVDVINSNGNTLGQNIRALEAGKVVRNVTKPDGDPGGVRIRVQTSGGYFYMYCHMIPGSNAGLNVGQTVNAGDILGQLGNTGKSTGPHVHIEIWNTNTQVHTWQNPLILYPNLQIRR
jgi:RHS repeat-associated protein